MLRLLVLVVTFGACAVEPTLDHGQHDLNADEALAVIDLVNDRSLSLDTLDNDETIRLDKRAATRLVALRDGADGIAYTQDDTWFISIDDIDAIPYIGPAALRRLRDYALANGYPRARISTVFSPQPYHQSHVVKVAEWLDAAENTIDIAMYSFSDNTAIEAMERAVARGVHVRLIYDGANNDRKASDIGATRSGYFERLGVDVRYVNKIMHHKFAIIDGPASDLSFAQTAKVISGSGNWSWGAASRYDENTLFIENMPELTLRLQREYNLLWNHSRDFAHQPFAFTAAGEITDGDINDGPWSDVGLTSPNFNIKEGSTTFRINGGNAVSDALVAAIASAESSIDIASGHLRSRPISLALIAAAEANPELRIRVYLDGQEYVSEYAHQQQLADQAQCLADATTASQQRKCLDKGFRYGYLLAQTPNIDVRYKHYAYYWHFSYAVQMHHKYLLIDNKELWTGSYNLSDNAEHNTFENIVRLSGPIHQRTVSTFADNFAAIWETGRGDAPLLPALRETIESTDSIPLVYESMALTWQEVSDLKDLLEANCPNIGDYYSDPSANRSCPRD